MTVNAKSIDWIRIEVLEKGRAVNIEASMVVAFFDVLSYIGEYRLDLRIETTASDGERYDAITTTHDGKKNVVSDAYNNPFLAIKSLGDKIR
jgi:hypothetical protein